jgi:DMSO/TMAO reductase YedYZ molybdopterin-dependent catalytic subunit
VDEDRQIEKKKYLADVLARLGEGLRRQAPAPLGSGPTNRHGMPAIPVGQHAVEHWPVLDLGVHPAIDRATWRLEVDGLVTTPLTLDWAAFVALPQVDDTSDFHCVTSWSRLNNRWRGVRFTTLAELAGVRPEARFVLATAHDHAPLTRTPYTTSLPLEDALSPDVFLVHTWEDQPLPVEHGGPVRMITPRLYAWKGAKWIKKITLLAEDRPGFWETRGYSNTARPWEDDRYNR